MCQRDNNLTKEQKTAEFHQLIESGINTLKLLKKSAMIIVEADIVTSSILLLHS